MTIIGLSGYMHSGKDTLGKYLVERRGYQRLAFADALKEVCRIVFDFSEEQLFGDLKETVDPFWGESPRAIMQIVGTELFRDTLGQHCPQIGKSVWLRALVRKVINAPAGQNFVITDVRFSEEEYLIKEMKGIVIRIDRETCPRQAHTSESGIDYLNPDYIIANNGTVDELFARFEQLGL